MALNDGERTALINQVSAITRAATTKLQQLGLTDAAVVVVNGVQATLHGLKPMSQQEMIEMAERPKR